MEVDELNKCMTKFYSSVRKTDGSYYKKTSLLSRSETPSTDALKPQNLSKICFFHFIFSNSINVIILKQLVASGDVNSQRDEVEFVSLTIRR